MKSIDPQISVIVPVYNVEKYLAECIDSILAQTYQNLEIILVDDGSPDSSGRICDEYAERYPKKIKVVHKANGGLSSARNVGLDVANGEYVGFVDSDDKILPEMYGEMYEAMTAMNVDVVDSNFAEWEYGHRVLGYQKEPYTGPTEEIVKRFLDWSINISVATKLLRRDLIGTLRFHEGLTNEDFPFLCELYLKDAKVHVMTKAYYLYRDNTNSITTVFKRSFFDVFDNVEFVDKLISSDKKELRTCFERYKLQVHIMSAMRIVLSKKNIEFKDWLTVNRGYMKKNVAKIVFDKKMNYRWKIKALIGFLRLPAL